MVVCYVTLQPSISQPPGKTVYALLLALDGKVSEAAGRLGGADQPPVLVAAPDNK